MPDAKPKSQTAIPVAPAAVAQALTVVGGASIDEIEVRQDEILRQLDALNDRILRVLSENGVTVPTVPGAIRAEKAA